MKHLPLNIPADHPAFPGHFPGMPIVPGVVLLDEAFHAITEACGYTGERWQISSVKFLSPLKPGEPAELRFETQPNGAIRFEITSDARNIAVGSMTLDTPA